MEEKWHEKKFTEEIQLCITLNCTDEKGVFHTGVGFCSFPVAGPAADKALLPWDFPMADVPALVPQ